MNATRRLVVTRGFIPAAVVLALPALALGAESSSGSIIPPINQGLVSALTTLAVFLTLLFVLGKFAFAPISAGLKKREDKIRQDIAEAEQARQKAEATLKDLTAKLNAAEAEARKITSQATADAEKIGVALKARAQQEAEELRERTLKEIEAAKNAAVAEVHEQAVYLSTTVAEKILKRAISAEDQRDLVRSSLDQLQTVGKN
jgi:F-type H+-transporting ATPase subunit b